MFNIPPTLPPTQYIIQSEHSENDALQEFATKNNISFETLDTFETQQKDDCSLRLVAHRGYSALAPENTIPAFLEAAKRGYKAVECDVSWTKDSVPVLLHDKTINRTAAHPNGSPVILPHYCSQMTYDELLKYDFGIKKGEKYKGTKIPTVEEFLEVCRDNDLSPYIELKEQNCVDEEKIKMLVDMVENFGLSEKTTWISFNADYLKIVSQTAPKARLAYLSSKRPDDDVLNTLRSLQTGSNEVVLDVKESKLTADSLNFIKQNGFDVEVWTVDDESLLDKIFSLGYSAITTDNLTNDTVEEYYDIFTSSH